MRNSVEGINFSLDIKEDSICKLEDIVKETM